MKIGIIGSGNIGATAAKLFANAGHEVAISNSRGPESLTSLVNSIGANIKAKTVEDAIKFGEVILLAIPWRKRQELLPASELFDGKIVIDAMNPYSENFEIIDLGNSTSSSEEVLKQIPSSSHLVKAFNTIYYELTLLVQGVILIYQKSSVLQSLLQEMIPIQKLLYRNLLKI
jgi:8-hydroxy-5-deazaflavin:NADPH oxidoreductase